MPRDHQACKQAEFYCPGEATRYPPWSLSCSARPEIHGIDDTLDKKPPTSKARGGRQTGDGSLSRGNLFRRRPTQRGLKSLKSIRGKLTSKNAEDNDSTMKIGKKLGSGGNEGTKRLYTKTSILLPHSNPLCQSSGPTGSNLPREPIRDPLAALLTSSVPSPSPIASIIQNESFLPTVSWPAFKSPTPTPSTSRTSAVPSQVPTQPSFPPSGETEVPTLLIESSPIVLKQTLPPMQLGTFSPSTSASNLLSASPSVEPPSFRSIQNPNVLPITSSEPSTSPTYRPSLESAEIVTEPSLPSRFSASPSSQYFPSDVPSDSSSASTSVDPSRILGSPSLFPSTFASIVPIRKPSIPNASSASPVAKDSPRDVPSDQRRTSPSEEQPKRKSVRPSLSPSKLTSFAPSNNPTLIGSAALFLLPSISKPRDEANNRATISDPTVLVHDPSTMAAPSPYPSNNIGASPSGSPSQPPTENLAPKSSFRISVSTFRAASPPSEPASVSTAFDETGDISVLGGGRRLSGLRRGLRANQGTTPIR